MGLFPTVGLTVWYDALLIHSIERTDLINHVCPERLDVRRKERRCVFRVLDGQIHLNVWKKASSIHGKLLSSSCI